MKVYIDTNDIGKTVSYKEENGKKQYLYAHDNEGFVVKDLAEHDKQVRKEIIKQVKDYMENHSHTITVDTKNRKVVYKIGLTRFLDQLQGE